jgi:diamine N-acetyltransferase
MVTIRRARTGDELMLTQLSRVVQGLHVEQRPDYFRPTETAALIAWYRTLLEQAQARVWLAELDGSAVGYVLAVVQQRDATLFTRELRWCQIDQLAVAPAYRRRGIGRTLVEQAIADARADGIIQIEATCWSFNATAQEMFRGLGFSPRVVRLDLVPPNDASE